MHSGLDPAVPIRREMIAATNGLAYRIALLRTAAHGAADEGLLDEDAWRAAG